MATNNGKIAFLDLLTPHAELESELTNIFQQALHTAGFIGGSMVEGFERDFARYCDTAYCVGLSSGTDAVRFALMAAGVQPGDVVVTVPHTFIATTEAISQAGARPDFVDIDEHTYCMDAVKLQEYLARECDLDSATGRPFHRKWKAPVTAVVPVHIYGQTADMDQILELARRYNLIVIEDACQAHGAEYFSRAENRWRKAGSMGQVAAFSFYPGKNLGACGEAGAITTNDEEMARKIRVLRDHGQTQKYYHEVEGYNGRLDAIQAGILQVKLKHLPEWTEMRRSVASRYRQLFAAAGLESVTLPYEPEWTKCVYHLFVVRVKNREEIMKHLGAMGIGTGIHYPIPLHLQTAYKTLGYKRDDFPVAERVCGEVLSLPMYPNLRADQQARVVSELNKIVSDTGQWQMEPKLV